MKSNYEEKKAFRLSFAEKQIENHKQKSIEAFQRSEKLSEAFYMGQPILVDHYSAPAMINRQKKMHNAMRKSIEHDKIADHYKQTVSAITSNRAISSDDPQAIPKLKEKLADISKEIEDMKAANKKQRGSHERFELSNRGAEKRRLEKRILHLEKTAQRPYRELRFKNEKIGIKVIENPTENRIQLFFDEKPDEATRAILNKHRFNFSRSAGNAWQRFLNNAGVYEAENVLRSLNVTVVKKDDLGV